MVDPMAAVTWMRPEDEDAVRRLYAQGHPGWPDRPAEWFYAYPTLLVEQKGRIAGFTSFSLGMLTGALVLHGQDVVVEPESRGRRLGHALHQARLDVGRNVGATSFSGVTAEDTLPMQRIFQAAGHHACQTVRGYYPDGSTGVIWVGAL